MSLTVDICGKRTLEYVTDCLGKFNRKTDEVIIRAFGGNITKGVRVAQILTNEFSNLIEIKDINLHPISINKVTNSILKIVLICKCENTRRKYEAKMFFDKNRFVTFPIYHLLFDSLLEQKGKIDIYCGDNKNIDRKCRNKKLVTITKAENGGISCLTQINNKSGQANKNKDEKVSDETKDILDQITAAFYRSGLLQAGNWKEVAKKISDYDDIIIGVDTNILLDAALSEQLLSSLSFVDPIKYVHTPNWMLFVVPGAVMHEVEQASNSRKYGQLNKQGRRGFRALQEILELGQSADLSGISLLIYGDTHPELDTIVEIKGLRKDLARIQNHLLDKKAKQQKKPNYLSSPKRSSGDTIIRDQFKHFLRQLNFYRGGVFFITSDKTNASLAQAEGVCSIYYKSPQWQDVITRNKKTGEINKISLQKIDCSPLPKANTDQNLTYFISVPIGKLIYELAVQFGTLRMNWDNNPNNNIEISCDAKGESLDRWIKRDLRIAKSEHLDKLVNHYRGKISLDEVANVWGNISGTLTKTKFI